MSRYAVFSFATPRRRWLMLTAIEQPFSPYVLSAVEMIAPHVASVVAARQATASYDAASSYYAIILWRHCHCCRYTDIAAITYVAFFAT